MRNDGRRIHHADPPLKGQQDDSGTVGLAAMSGCSVKGSGGADSVSSVSSCSSSSSSRFPLHVMLLSSAIHAALLLGGAAASSSVRRTAGGVEHVGCSTAVATSGTSSIAGATSCAFAHHRSTALSTLKKAAPATAMNGEVRKGFASCTPKAGHSCPPSASFALGPSSSLTVATATNRQRVCIPLTSLSATSTDQDEETIKKDIEYATHSTDDKILQLSDMISGSINITSIEDVNGLHGHVPPKNGKVQPAANGAAETKQQQQQVHDEKEEGSARQFLTTTRNLWKRRHARSIQEGIRREKTALQTPSTKTGLQLSSLLKNVRSTPTTLRITQKKDGGDEKTTGGDTKHTTTQSKKKSGGKYAARTISGLIMALAEEADGLEVEVDARRDTPLWGKHVDAVRINFSRLGFKPIKIGGLDQAIKDLTALPASEKDNITDYLTSSGVTTADEAFSRIDLDNSGALDEDEIARALSIAAHREDRGGRARAMLEGLATNLVQLYDANGDGVVDREEYQSMVEDMAALRRAQKLRKEEREERERRRMERQKLREERRANGRGWRRVMVSAMRTALGLKTEEARAIDAATSTENGNAVVTNPAREGVPLVQSGEKANGKIVPTSARGEKLNLDDAVEVSEDVVGTMTRGEGSIVLSDLKLDLRRLLFGAFPVVKTITPGGPLILEPFTMTVTGSFNRQDIMSSKLLDAGLRRLVARALRRRVRGLRDLLDGAVFYGRTWNMASASAPIVEVPKLTNVEFDKKDRIIITGVAQVRTTPDSPMIENTFKLRTKLGTRENGQVIRLKDPELALVIECPRACERGIVSACKKLGLPVPTRPEPIYTYFPLVSPFKVTDKDGFNLGEDNCIKSIDIKDGALLFEVSAILRPGRFLGNHYLAFTVPNRTFIITLDRVREGIRVARRNKRAREAAAREAAAASRRRASDVYRGAVAQSLSKRTETKEGSSDELDDLRFIEPTKSKTASGSAKNKKNENGNNKGFIARFVEGYVGTTAEEINQKRNERLFDAISEWFGRQDTTDGGEGGE